MVIYIFHSGLCKRSPTVEEPASHDRMGCWATWLHKGKISEVEISREPPDGGELRIDGTWRQLRIDLPEVSAKNGKTVRVYIKGQVSKTQLLNSNPQILHLKSPTTVKSTPRNLNTPRDSCKRGLPLRDGGTCLPRAAWCWSCRGSGFWLHGCRVVSD